MLTKIINSQMKLSEKFDDIVMPSQFRVSNYYFRSIISTYIRENSVIYEIGGGKHPFTSRDLKTLLQCQIVGVDIDEGELENAPAAVYDKTIVADITKYRGIEDGDIAICLMVLEHVKDTKLALQGIASCLKKGGYCAILLPSGNALYSWINRMLPEGLKRRLLFSIFPQSKNHANFRAYYDHCTPGQIKQACKSIGLEIVEERYYYQSPYFSFFFPLYVLWRIYLLLYYILDKKEAAETFGLVLRKS